MKYLQKILKRFRRDERGSVAVETGLIAILLGGIAVGVIDLGIAYNRTMELSNAVRAGMQYASVRKPVAGDMTAIEAAIEAAIPENSFSAEYKISVSMFCECPDGSDSDCTSSGGISIECSDGSTRYSFLSISIAEDFGLIFAYPGLGDSIQISRSALVRLN